MISRTVEKESASYLPQQLVGTSAMLIGITVATTRNALILVELSSTSLIDTETPGLFLSTKYTALSVEIRGIPLLLPSFCERKGGEFMYWRLR